jgi:predicted dehydrogenase
MPSSPVPPRIIVIGAGSRGSQYSKSVTTHTPGSVVAIAEPIAFKRNELGQKYIWGPQGRTEPQEGEAFEDWQQFIQWELERRKSGNPSGIDAAIVCTLDETHIHIVKGLAELGLHILCEKPLATRLDDVLGVRKAVRDSWKRIEEKESQNGATGTNGNGASNGSNGTAAIKPKTIFSICHVLRYSPHNMLLRDLVLKQRVVGDILSVEHTEPVGWWHFSHR